jgi:outer membrane murein-binding lipoprotein Lpp
MPGMMENLSTLNSFLRTVIALVVIGGVSAASYFGYTTFNAKEIEAAAKSRELADAQQKLEQALADVESQAAEIATQNTKIAEQATEITALNQEVEKLETSVALLKVRRRVARLTAIDQKKDEATGKLRSLVEFVELNDEGNPLETPRQFEIPGDEVYVDGWLVKFDDEYVESADLERGTSLLLFKRLFGNDQKPDDGYPLDQHGAAPKAYARGGKMSDFEKGIFDDFWSIANDKTKAEEKGIRAIHGLAGYIKVQPGQKYTVELGSTGDVSVIPAEAEKKD